MQRRGVLTTVLAAVALVTGVCSAPAALADPEAMAEDPASLVNPLIGTTNLGNTYPGAVAPFGMLAWSPELSKGNATRTAAPGGYHYDVNKVRGFSLTHMSGTGCAGGSGDIPFFPHVGTVTTSPAADGTDAVYASTFKHDNEVAKAGSYKVGLDSGATAELTATTRTGSGRFTFPADKPGTMLIRTANSETGSTASDVTVDAATRTVTGSVTSGNFCGYINQVGRRSYYTLHFVAQFDQPFKEVGTWQDGVVTPGSTTSTGATTYGTSGWPVVGKGSGAYIGFDTAAASTTNVKVGISYVSLDNAKANLKEENPPKATFEKTRDNAVKAWSKQLGKIEVGGGTPEQRTTFYTALYHALLHPNAFSDVNGEYWGMDGKPHKVTRKQKVQYGTFSGWDVYRSQLQLLTLLEPETGSDIAQSLLNQADQNGGVWDRWTHNSGGTHVMNGDPSAPALAGIYAFGGRDFDVKAALKSLVRAATVPTEQDLSKDGWAVMSVGQRPSLDKYLQLHYMPSVSNAWGGAAETLEMSTADFALSELAKDVKDPATAKVFAERSQWWQNNFDPVAHSSGGYVRNRNADGTWVKDFVPGTENGFVEGTSAQYSWMVPHNVAGLVESMGGKDRFTKRLDDFFHKADGSWALSGAGGDKAALDNEPSINSPWLYDYAGQPHKAQQTIRQVLNTMWGDKTGGIPGNDDLGAMSSWYVFAAMGMYPQVSSRAELVLGSPLFPKIKVDRPDGKDITITAPKAAADAPYVQSLKVNGKASTKPWLPTSFVEKGGKLDYVLGTTANTSWGSNPADAPPSFRDGEQPIKHDQPFYLTVSPTSPTLAPGGSVTAAVQAKRLYDGDPAVTYTATGDSALVFTPATGTVPIDDTGARFAISTTPDAPQGFYSATVTVTVAGAQPVVLPLTVKVAPPGSMLAAVNNIGASDDAGSEVADFDGGGYSYSRQALAAAGLSSGATGTVDGLTFTWPNSPNDRADNVVTNGQSVDVTGTKLSFIGAAADGGRTAAATVTYTDGTTGTVDLGFSDWTLGGGGQNPSYGNVVVAKTPYRNLLGGGNEQVVTNIFATKTFTAPEGKVLKSVQLPTNEGLHVFAIATA
ncbi:GH92 family glycosyl hydrolase [Umezawaea tangerina]|uniref:Putative alpha-1,2-mannosidase n=1 Tax=Umezawaea tangerina TaxID=84725 RepID=A0A2T0TAZ4_9PSEU|nr:GH92 family glycosyl hydrolase [Umezawaea tangerina]PRY42843.1 putative alpha-1,2-mannosidase [Umezawaea tangerina]